MNAVVRSGVLVASFRAQAIAVRRPSATASGRLSPMTIGPRPVPVVDEIFGALAAEFRLSIIVVAWQADAGLAACVDRLVELTPSDVEVLVVGNAVDLRPAVAPLFAAGGSGRVLQLAENDGPSPARNVAADRARSPVLAFLDDDARIEPGWVEALIEGVGRDGVVAVRGRVAPDSRPVLTRLARAYDLGDERRIASLNTEANMAVRTGAFLEVGGFAAMFGHEGVELTGRLRDRYGAESIWYEPAAVIRHDYVTGFGAYFAKKFRHGTMMRRLRPVDVCVAASIRPPQLGVDRLLSPIRLAGTVVELAGAVWGSVRRIRRS